MSNNKLLRDVKNLIARYGHKVDRFEESRHFKFWLSTCGAGPQMMVISKTIGDSWRAIKNIEGQLKRWK